MKRGGRGLPALGAAAPRFLRVKSADGLEQVGILTPTGYLSPDDIPVELRPGDLVACEELNYTGIRRIADAGEDGVVDLLIALAAADQAVRVCPVGALLPKQPAARVPLGERLLYVHMGYGSVFEREVIIRVEKGRVVVFAAGTGNP